jgi:PhzF family phenazine biosynthesis protein
VLTVRRDGALLAMDFPACPPEKVEPPEGLAAALGISPSWTGRNAQNDVLAVVDDADAVRSLTPDVAALGRIDARGVCVTAADTDHDFVSRFFAPAVGIPEDPVTGSAHCMLAPFWAERLGRTRMTGYQASARGGQVMVATHGDRVVLSGSAVTVLEGTLHAEPS